MTKRQFIIIYRLGFAAVILAAIATQFMDGTSKQPFNAGNFFSFFTIQSNLLAALAFIVSAAMLLKRKKTSPNMELFRSAAALYMLMTGIIFALLLSGLVARLQTTIPWVNSVLHEIAPAVLLADWLFDRPQYGVRFSKALYWAIYPGAYAVYSLTRGAIVHWYPYPFLDPRHEGYGHVALTALIISVVVLGAICLMAWITRLPGGAATRRISTK
jgi:hypothetical protein